MIAGILRMFGGTPLPDDIVPINDFDIARYVGKWYEIARFDNRFEKNMNNTTAEYSPNDDGTVKVVNKGFDTVSKKWKQVTGKAKFVGDNKVGMLKVSFFGPFYAGYNVILLDPEYKYSLVCGDKKGYLWLLSREKAIPESIKNEYITYAKLKGFDVSKLNWIKHD